MKEDLNQQFEERYLLVLSDEERLYESISELTKGFAEGKIPSELYVKSLDIANATVQEIHSKRAALRKLIKQIRYHLFKMKEYIEINYEDGMDFIVVPNQDYTKLYNDFLTRSHHFIKEWNQYEKEHGLCIPEMTSEIRSFELVFKMIQLLLEEYDAHIYPDQELLHIYTLTRQVTGLLTQARDLTLSMNPKIIADQYYTRKYMGIYSNYFHQDFEFKQARANGYPDFEYVREPGFRPWDREQRRHADLVPESQMHQQMTGDIGQFQSNQFNETKHFKSRLFEAGLGLRTYQPTERPISKTNDRAGWQSTMGDPVEENLSKEDTPEENIPEEFPARQSVTPPSIASGTITPPGPKLYRDNNTRKS